MKQKEYCEWKMIIERKQIKKEEQKSRVREHGKEFKERKSNAAERKCNEVKEREKGRFLVSY